VNVRRWLLALALLGVAMFGWWRHALTDSASAQVLAPRTSPLAPQFMGAGSCASAACHNANFTHGDLGSEYTTWITRDRHARAYEILFADRSKTIQKNLAAKLPAHQDMRCLRCHVTPDLDPSAEKKAPYFRTDGVSCESCHGAAEKWLNVHHLPAWKDMTAAAKKQHGMNDLQSVPARVQFCVRCHVGEPGMDVDHDLIAAGHPRLAFEMTAFHAFMPHHWSDAKDRTRTDFEARMWVAGQLAQSHAALELIAHRAGDAKHLWPEFAFHDCVSCHHDLKSPPRLPTAVKVGTVPWSAWDLAMAPRAWQAADGDPKVLAKLRSELDKGWNNRKGIGVAAKDAAQQLRTRIDRTDRIDADFLAIIQQILTEDATKTMEEHRVQAGLALVALQQDRKVPPATGDAINAYARKLEIPRGPDLEPIRARIQELRRR
jgi:Cytochrome c554 and c-prime